MIVGVCGLGWTGSGAVKDLLTEFDEIYNVGADKTDYEFGIIYKTDGILDLRDALFSSHYRDISSQVAFSRFIDGIEDRCQKPSRIQKLTYGKYRELSYEYIGKLSQIDYNYYNMNEYVNGGRIRRYWGRLLYKLQREINRRTKKHIQVFPTRKCFFSICPECFDEITCTYIEKIIESMRVDREKIILLDQPFSGLNPEESMRYFKDPYCIVVDRDPRDLFIIMKHICFYKPDLTNDVNKFIEYFTRIRSTIDYSSNDRILRIQFEDLIYKYDKTCRLIQDYLALENHGNKLKIFNPSVSIQNTQLWKRYPKEVYNIHIIQEKLKGWLYHFESDYEIDQTIKNF